jgi:shikimate kinase
VSVKRVYHVYLLGFMGSGKSTVGRLVAERLVCEFVDLDAAIEAQEGRSVEQIFTEAGEARFREIETALLGQVSDLPPCVVALGGGAWVDPRNQRIVDQTGIAVHLEAGLETILERVPADGTRPLFSTPERVAALYRERLPSYRLAKVGIVTDDLLPDQVADRVVHMLEQP